MAKRRIPIWLLLMLAPFGLLLIAIPALLIFARLTATRLHPSAGDVPTISASAPLPKWASAVEQAQRQVRSTLAEQNLPGLSVAVGLDNEIVWAEGFGFATLQDNIPVTPNHRFRIGTASIALTSAAAGLLLERNQLKLDDEIQAHVPAFPKKQWPVTLRQVMGHTAGLVPDGGNEGRLLTKHCQQPMDAVAYFAEDPLLFQPGTEYIFSSYDWVLMSAAVEAATTQPFLKFMQQQIFDPVGVRDTIADPSTAEGAEDEGEFPLFNLLRELISTSPKQRISPQDPSAATAGAENRVTSYLPRFIENPKNGLRPMRPLDYSCYTGASVFLSTPSDLVRFGMAINSGKLLKPATVELMQTSQRLPSGEDTGYGLGWERKTVTLAGKQTPVVGHDGDALGGTLASLITFPEYGLTVAVASNISHTDTFAIGMKIAEAFVVQGKVPVRQ